MSAMGTTLALGDLLDPVVVLRAFFLAASLLILVTQAVPALRTRFLPYGSRATDASKKERPAPRPSALDKLLDYAASFQVPHNYFTHFYVVSVACSLFWAWRLRLWDASLQRQTVWALMLLQGVRRTLESYAFTSSSKSTMWFAHWILGLAFYVAINIAIWVEGPARQPAFFRTTLLVPLILVAHELQHSYHAYLFRLRTENKGYQLPSHPRMPNLLCPHYTCEIAIYACLAFLAAPARTMVNWTLVCGTVFVAINLGVTAAGTKEWYMERFGAEKVGPRRRMVPWLW